MRFCHYYYSIAEVVKKVKLMSLGKLLYLLREPDSTFADSPPHAALSVYRYQAEARPPAITPFKVVQQAPVEVTDDFHPFAERPLHSHYSLFQPPAAVLVVHVGYAVFGD